MKNALYLALSILILGNLSHAGMPWYFIVPIAVVAGWYFPLSAAKTFGFAFIAGFLLWYLNAFLLDSANQSVLSAKIGQLFQGLKSGPLLLVTGFLGGFLTGLAALTGRFASDFFVSRQPNS